MRFMVIEHFPPGDPLRVYRALAERGRGLPDGLSYVDSWVEAGFNRCFQIMETEDAALFHQWALHWSGAGVRLEITPILTSAETQALVAPYLADPPASSG
ncbi:hypothetical protein ATO6_19055 [Oceanicola sp. 22II-s10i]|uniref:DUF3303 domain-containing protein n=1 Tax=Oceanicola sp. 22II-s10i TaxID=1317116 RepID=UPI000B51FCD0|nr:DUF3303 family protein [Oceanicola sp. 22II-s10i]OWU83247.1 hypothetical protein ATO6_19055 [Oceanicola sp. 22II-s10i]